jgi:hypothetical protein
LGKLDDAALDVARLRDGLPRVGFDHRVAAAKGARINAENAEHVGIIWVGGNLGKKKAEAFGFCF